MFDDPSCADEQTLGRDQAAPRDDAFSKWQT